MSVKAVSYFRYARKGSRMDELYAWGVGKIRDVLAGATGAEVS